MAGPNDITSNPYDPYTMALRVRNVVATGTLLWSPVYFNLGDVNNFDTVRPSWWEITCPDTTHTVLTFKPDLGYYLEGGFLEMISTPSTYGVMKAKVVAVPDIPEQYGGSIVFAENELLLPNKNFELYSSATYFQYSSEQPINRIQLTIVHEETDNFKFKFVLKIHR